MRLKSAMLVHPIRTPWNGTNLTESLSPRDGWEVSVVGDMIHLVKDGEVRTIVSMAMLRWAEVAEKEEPEASPATPPTLHDLLPNPPQPVTVTLKRRGRPPKKSV
jgi:hypothetical protein